MTRINVVPVEELSDQHLIAEYRELPRVIKQNIDIINAPERYKLGEGHMKWAKKHSIFVLDRYFKLCDEMAYRGFKVNHTGDKLYRAWLRTGSPETDNAYVVDAIDMVVNRRRLIEKYKEKPQLYRWTKRVKPRYYDDKVRVDITWTETIIITLLLMIILAAFMCWE